MFTGIDIGGTNTDIAVVGEEISTVKVPNTEGLDRALALVRISGRLAVSTSQPLNLLVTGTGGPVHLLTIPGVGLMYPGMVKGMVNHRGDLLEEIDENEVRQAIAAEKADAIAITGKFSVRNPVLEERVAEIARAYYPADRIAVSHHLGGLGFPARMETARINARIMHLVGRITGLVSRQNGNFYYLKGDGGLVTPAIAGKNPSQLYNSSPAAVALGAHYLSGIADACVVDIGGTTTDLVPLQDGLPLTDEVTIDGRRTFIRSIRSVSLPFGGDSVIEDGLSPRRLGCALAFGGPYPTLTDALNRIGHAIGDDSRSQDLAIPMAEKAVRQYLDAVVSAIREQDPPVLIGTGYLASELIPAISRETGVPAVVPDHAACANAVGVAVSRVSLALHVRADTGRNVLVINGDVQRMTETWADEDLIVHSLDLLKRRASALGAPEEDVGDAELVSFRAYDVVRSGARAERIADLTVRIPPGITVEAP
jgi:N-methylhydantoinase A/oxoprolinase/acetone carboxylase beta subunit